MDQQMATVTLTIDGKAVTVPKGTTVYHAARQAGIEIPIFCYHDRMPPLGACRMCLVQVEQMGKLQTSCTLDATDGMVVHATTPQVQAGQQAILEFLLINHPLDCPICDKGGECPLQDQTYEFGPGRSRFIEAKRDFAKPVSLGQVLVLDRERCILCWRCVRFGEMVAGDDALKGFERGFRSEINTPFTLPVQSKFIGNTIAICPVGALTAKTYRFAARPWDNRAVPSVCTLCGVGCAVEFDVRGGAITRTRAREYAAVNDIWLCDLGFFGHAYVHHADRLRQPLVRRDGGLVPTTWEEALEIVARRLRMATSRAAMLGGARLTNEDAYVAGRFFRTVVGTNHIDHRVDARPNSPSLLASWGMAEAIADLGTSDVIVLAGCDITEEYPVIWLRIKQAVDRGASIIAMTPKALEIDRFIAYHLVHRYGEGGAVLAALAQAARGKGRKTGSMGGVAHADLQAAGEVLARASHPAVMIGRTALEAPDGWETYRAAQELCAQVNATLSVMRGKGNAFGAALAGLLPDAGPGGRPLDDARKDLEEVWGAPVAQGAGMAAPEIVEAAARGQLDLVYVIGADPATDVPDGSRWAAARARVPFLVVQDAFLTGTAQRADVVLPALVSAEKDGTVGNLEGRIQRIWAAVPGPGEARGDWAILSALAEHLGTVIAYSGWEEIFDEMRTLMPGLALDARVPLARPAAGKSEARSPKQSGGGKSEAHLLLSADPDYPLTLIPGDVLFDRGSMTSRAPAIADLAGEPWALLHAEDAARAGVADGDPVVLTSRRGAVAVRARISPAILPGQVYLPRGYDGAPVNALVDLTDAVAAVRIHALASLDQARGGAVVGGAGKPGQAADTP